MWRTKLRCRACKKTYIEHPGTLYVGPLFDEIVTGQELVAGLTSFVTEKLYRGSTLKICCPYCLLRVLVAADLCPSTLRRYLPLKRDDLTIDTVIGHTDAVAMIREFPVHCPRCDRTIREAGESKKCKYCGTEQMDTLESTTDT